VGVILLVRHGQASSDAADYDNLSETGYVQGAVLGRSLAARGVRPARVLSGAMRRHGQTARAVVEAAGWDVEVDVDAGWNEFDHVQVLEVHGPPDGGEPAGRMSPREFAAWFDAAAQRWSAGGHDEEYDEPFDVFTGRVESALRRTSSLLGPGDVAVVLTSGGPISWVAASLLGGGVSTWMRLNPVTVNASVTKLVVGSRGTTLVSLNEHAHLEPDRVTYR
jgi:broad specificity phosphatase PhoE